MIVSPAKAINLVQLHAELATASINVPALGATSDPSGHATDVHTYDAAGAIADLPAGAASVVQAHVAQPDAWIQQRMNDAATLLNDASVRDTQTHRDAFARLISVRPLTIPLTQDAVSTDIAFAT